MYDIKYQSNQEYLIKNNSYNFLKCFWFHLPFLLIAIQGDRGLICDHSIFEQRRKQNLLRAYYVPHIVLSAKLHGWRQKG